MKAADLAATQRIWWRKHPGFSRLLWAVLRAERGPRPTSTEGLCWLGEITGSCRNSTVEKSKSHGDFSTVSTALENPSKKKEGISTFPQAPRDTLHQEQKTSQEQNRKPNRNFLFCLGTPLLAGQRPCLSPWTPRGSRRRFPEVTNTRNYPSFDRCLRHFSVPPPSSSLKSDEGSELYLRKREFHLFLPDVDDRGDKPGEQAHQAPVSAWPEPHPTTTHSRRSALHRPPHFGDLRHRACWLRTHNQGDTQSRPLTKSWTGKSKCRSMGGFLQTAALKMIVSMQLFAEA